MCLDKPVFHGSFEVETLPKNTYCNGSIEEPSCLLLLLFVVSDCAVSQMIKISSIVERMVMAMMLCGEVSEEAVSVKSFGSK